MAREGKARNVPGAVGSIKASGSEFASTWRKMTMRLAGRPCVAPPATPVAAKKNKKSAASTKKNKFRAPLQAPVDIEPVAAIGILPAEDGGEVSGWVCPCIIL